MANWFATDIFLRHKKEGKTFRLLTFEKQVKKKTCHWFMNTRIHSPNPEKEDLMNLQFDRRQAADATLTGDGKFYWKPSPVCKIIHNGKSTE